MKKKIVSYRCCERGSVKNKGEIFLGDEGRGEMKDKITKDVLKSHEEIG